MMKSASDYIKITQEMESIAVKYHTELPPQRRFSLMQLSDFRS
jgi:hypothetical protein